MPKSEINTQIQGQKAVRSWDIKKDSNCEKGHIRIENRVWGAIVGQKTIKLALLRAYVYGKNGFPLHNNMIRYRRWSKVQVDGKEKEFWMKSTADMWCWMKVDEFSLSSEKVKSCWIRPYTSYLPCWGDYRVARCVNFAHWYDCWRTWFGQRSVHGGRLPQLFGRHQGTPAFPEMSNGPLQDKRVALKSIGIIHGWLTRDESMNLRPVGAQFCA